MSVKWILLNDSWTANGPFTVCCECQMGYHWGCINTPIEKIGRCDCHCSNPQNIIVADTLPKEFEMGDYLRRETK